MRKYVSTTVILTVWLFVSWLIPTFVVPFVGVIPQLILRDDVTGLIVDVISWIIASLFLVTQFVVLYFAIRNVGYKINIMPWAELLVPTAIAAMLYTLADIWLDFLLLDGITFRLIRFVTNGSHDIYRADFIDAYRSTFIFAASLRSLVYMAFMIWSFLQGYKKHAQDKEKMMSIKSEV